MNKKIIVVLSLTAALAGCASSVDSVMFSNAAKVYLFTPEEQAQMTPDGAIETMITPSEIRKRFQNAGKVTKPTGAVNYCGSGLAQLVSSRRNSALEAIDGACGGKDNYTIRRESSGYIEVTRAGQVRIGADCNRPIAIYFRCNGAQPKLQ